ncbi:hypothetical protein [Amycolatopsis lexingtonensis]|uniref:hypothetical protein n=1 Tax=Amycolatopsis lexingtonensis TaxID=218822 RepID=UPI003F6E655A
MNENTQPGDPIGPPVLPRPSQATARVQALAGRRPRRDGLDTLSTWTTISQHAQDG